MTVYDWAKPKNLRVEFTEFSCKTCYLLDPLADHKFHCRRPSGPIFDTRVDANRHTCDGWRPDYYAPIEEELKTE